MRKTTQDLVTRLTDVNDTLESLLMTAKKSPPVDTYHIESESIERCPDIYSETMGQIYEAKLRPTLRDVDLKGDVDSSSLRQLMMATADTLATLRECRKELSDIKTRLLVHEEKVAGHPSAGLEPTGTASRRGASQLTTELNPTEQGPCTCSKTSTRSSTELFHSLEDITAGKDSRQILISTSGKLFHAKRVTAGDRSLLLVGSCSNTTLQACVRDFR